MRKRIECSSLSARRRASKRASRSRRKEIKHSNSALLLHSQLEETLSTHLKDSLRRSRDHANTELNSTDKLFIELNANRNERKITTEASVQTDSKIIAGSSTNNDVEASKLQKMLANSSKNKSLAENLSITHCKPLNIQDKLRRRLAPEEIYRAIDSILPRRTQKAKRYSRFLTKGREQFGLSRNRATASTPGLKPYSGVSIHVAGEDITLEDAASLEAAEPARKQETLDSTDYEKHCPNSPPDQIFTKKDCNKGKGYEVEVIRHKAVLKNVSANTVKDENMKLLIQQASSTTRFDSKKPGTPSFGSTEKRFNFTLY